MHEHGWSHSVISTVKQIITVGPQSHFVFAVTLYIGDSTSVLIGESCMTSSAQDY